MVTVKMKKYFILLFVFHAATSKTLSSTQELTRSKRYMSRPKGWNPVKVFGDGVGVEELLNPERYHKYIRPDVRSQNPLAIGVGISVTSLDKISDADMEYTITFTLYQTWRDDRLDKPLISRLKKPITMDSIIINRMWVPDTYIVNARTSFIHEVTTRNGLVILHPNGKVVYVLRITSQVACPMKLLKYPMDNQVCRLRFASWSFPKRDLIYQWNGEEKCGAGFGSVVGMEHVLLPQFNITSCNVYATNHTRLLGNYSELVMEFGLKRNVRFFFMRTYVPSILLVMLSWVSFWINVNAVPARVALGITTVLSMTTLMIGVYNSGPKSTSYVKAIDLYVLVCYGFIFSAMIEYAGVHYYLRHETTRAHAASQKIEMMKKSNGTAELAEEKSETVKVISVSLPASEKNICNGLREKKTKIQKIGVQPNVKHLLHVEKIDLIFMLIFPMLFGFFNAIYWWVYLAMED